MLQTDTTRAGQWRDLRERIAAHPDERVDLIAQEAKIIRRDIVTTIDAARAGHIGGDLSVTDILATLYFGVLHLDPADPRGADRDRFVLSKGHCAAALYSTLARVGYFSEAELPTFMKPGSALNGHPNRNKVPGVETNTGPLGHGLPVAVGEALGLRLQGSSRRVFVVTGDGELQEGSNWEALMAAGHFGLQNLTLIVDRNRLQQGAGTEETNGLDPLPERLAAFGCEVRDIDGHDIAALFDALSKPGDGRPVAVIANTTKGKGVSFIEGGVEWHHKVPSAEQVARALEELA
ncbi:MAG: transketolase [Arachnia sp.]